jgi:hypothetical protein
MHALIIGIVTANTLLVAFVVYVAVTSSRFSKRGPRIAARSACEDNRKGRTSVDAGEQASSSENKAE